MKKILFLLFFACGNAYALTANVSMFPSSGTDDASFGASVWTNPGNIVLDDGSNATNSRAAGTTDYLVGKQFNFNIATASIIVGIVVSPKYQTPLSCSGAYTDARVRLIKGGTIGSTDRSLIPSWPATIAYVDHGGSTDLWGDTWTAADINSPDFGVAIAGTYSGIGVCAGTVDTIQITIYYTLATGGGVILDDDDF